jgi:hypothetical protein
VLVYCVTNCVMSDVTIVGGGSSTCPRGDSCVIKVGQGL